ncbi:MAG TPA: CehA/McbA family metallohydrolase, partial [Patescibacteria group bacterium]|nr:CehA/McbA family metallohydrolase [Patescibacteria group bacterium]
MKRLTVVFVWLLVMSGLMAQEATLRGVITDEQTGQLSPCTVAITNAKGQLVLDGESFRGGFRCSGEFNRVLPPGHTHIRVSRGPETQAIERDLDLLGGQTAELKLALHRNIDLRKRGWWAGDSHVHMLHGERTWPVSFDFVATTAKAQDLQYLSLAQAWQIDKATPEALQAQLQPRSTPRCVLTWNLEAPKNYYKGDAGRCLGHCWNLGLRGRTTEGADVIRVLLEASAWDYESEKQTFMNFESHRLIHEQGGAVFYTHPARWWMGPWGGKAGYPKVEQMRVSNMAVELPLDTILGPTFDGVDVITGSGEFETNDKAFELWTMLLNHGYRLAATGSSDACFDRPGGAIPGIPRTYTYSPGEFSIEKVTRATAAAHTFVTTGPLLLASIDGKPPGSAFKLGNQKHIL